MGSSTIQWNLRPVVKYHLRRGVGFMKFLENGSRPQPPTSLPVYVTDVACLCHCLSERCCLLHYVGCLCHCLRHRARRRCCLPMSQPTPQMLPVWFSLPMKKKNRQHVWDRQWHRLESAPHIGREARPFCFESSFFFYIYIHICISMGGGWYGHFTVTSTCI